MELTNDLAALIGFAWESVLWGVNCTLFVISVIILWHRHRAGEGLRNPVVYLNTLIFFCCTAHFALEFYHFYTTLNAIGVNGYANETHQLVGADLLISFTDLLGDFLLIYRCWLLWGRMYQIIILPILSSLGGFACIIGVIVLLLGSDPTSPAPPPELVPLGIAGYALPLGTNVMVTSLIVYRIWSTSRTPDGSSLKIGQGATGRAMMLIIESGLLYLLFQLVYVVLFAMSTPSEAILAVMSVQIYGIAPTLIIIRVGLGISSEQTLGTAVSTRLNWVVRRGETTGYTTEVEGPKAGLEGLKASALSAPELYDQDLELNAVHFEP